MNGKKKTLPVNGGSPGLLASLEMGFGGPDTPLPGLFLSATTTGWSSHFNHSSRATSSLALFDISSFSLFLFSSLPSSLLALFLSCSSAVGLANNFLTCISSPFEAARPPATPFGSPPPLHLLVHWGHFAGIAGWGVLSIGRCGWVYAARGAGGRYSIEKRNGFFPCGLVQSPFCSLLGLARIAGGTRYKTGGAQPCRYGIRLGAASYSRRSAYLGHGPFGRPTVCTDNAAGTEASAHRLRLGWRRSGRRRVPATRNLAHRSRDTVPVLVPVLMPVLMPMLMPVPVPVGPLRQALALWPHTHFCRPRGSIIQV